MATENYDNLEVRDPQARERAQMSLLPDLIRRARDLAPGWAAHLKGIEPSEITSRQALAKLPVLRKSSLSELQARKPPFGGFSTGDIGTMARIFMSPGPIFEPEGRGEDWWRSARALYAAGFRHTDIVLNTFSYHLTPGGWIMDAGARALGCAVIPAGTGNVEHQVEAVAHIKPTAYVGLPEYLKVLLDKARDMGRDTSSLRRALVSGSPMSPALRQELKLAGVAAFQAYATADVGIIAYESSAHDGFIVDEGIIVEIVRPGTSEPVALGEIGEVIVTSFNRDYPMIRLATGDLSSLIEGQSSCGRTNMRIKGWLGRADQPLRVRGQVLGPEHLVELVRRHGELGRVRAIVSREGEQDIIALRAEAASHDWGLANRVSETFTQLTRLTPAIQLVAPGSLPGDGHVLIDERQ
jgi:phenylacetate-CoA ligase